MLGLHDKADSFSPQKSEFSSITSIAVVSFVLLTCVSAYAENMPVTPLSGAGALGNQLRQQAERPPAPPVSAPLVLPATKQARQHLVGDNRTVIVKKVVFTGVPVDVKGLNEVTLQQAVSSFLNQPLTFSGLEAMAQKVTDLYRGHGVLLAQTVLPPQTIKDGVLTLQVIPGRYDAAEINNTSSLRTSIVQRLIRTTTPEHNVVTQHALEREALLFNDIPGVTAQVFMKAGRQAGTTVPDIRLDTGKTYGAYVGADNQGDPTTGRSRVMVGGYANNLLGLGDQLRVDVLDAYENSNLFNGSLDYSLLVGGGYGTRVGANYSHLNYRYSVNKQSFNGYSDNWGVYFTQPWIRTSQARVDVRLDAGQQYLTDNYPSMYSSMPGYFGGKGTQGRKQVSFGSFSLVGSVADLPGGLTGFGLSGTTGSVGLRSDISQVLEQQADSGGHFARINYQLNHEQQVWGPFALYGGVNGQEANHNLEASQKFLMGGPTAVRAYDIGDGLVDEGVVGTAEIRGQWHVPVLRWLGNDPKLTVATFYDQGWGKQYRSNFNKGADGYGERLADDNNLNLAGAGLYATVADAGNYGLTLTWAHRTGGVDPNAVHNDSDRFWVSAVKTF